MMNRIARVKPLRDFGHLVVLWDLIQRLPYGDILWLCLCECGTLTKVTSSNLISGNTKSCGCFRRDKATKRLTGNKIGYKHGDAWGIRLYQTWKSMKSRCYYKKNRSYNNYGGRGIIVCNKWKNDYSVFKKWALSNGYADNLTIDRIDNDKGYYPDNCQWMTRSENTKKALRKKK